MLQPGCKCKIKEAVDASKTVEYIVKIIDGVHYWEPKDAEEKPVLPKSN